MNESDMKVNRIAKEDEKQFPLLIVRVLHILLPIGRHPKSSGKMADDDDFVG